MSEEKSFFAGAEAISSMRYNGYKNAAMALGELVDNSIQESASKVTIVVEVEKSLNIERKTMQIRRIAVIDNGLGMTDDILESCLRIGYGTRRQKKGMGKYGVGLPNASISQCQITEVWSWQNGVSAAKYTKLDITHDDWFQSGMIMPKPIIREVPMPWIEYVDRSVEHGTIVLWSKLDLLKWKTPRTLFSNSEFLIGRMYRHWIENETVEVQFITVEADTFKKLDSKVYRAVDPLYLMSNTSVSDVAPIIEGKKIDPMFELVREESFELNVNGKKEVVTIRGSVAKEGVRTKKDGRDAGELEHGKHAAKNMGLSIVRESRELILDPEWAHTIGQKGKPVNRWWGVEIEFGSNLDSTFGVENNKQRANTLKEAEFKSFDDYKEIDESDHDVRKRLEQDDPDLYNCLYTIERLRKLTEYVVKKVPPVTGESADERSGKKRRIVEEGATAGSFKRQNDGSIGSSDKILSEPTDKRRQTTIDNLSAKGYSKFEIEEILMDTIDTGYRYVYRSGEIDSEAFFSVEPEAGNYIIIWNKSHPLYSRLSDLFEEIDGDKASSIEELRRIAIDMYDAIKIIVASWARMEDEASGERKGEMKKIRRVWGEICSDLIGEGSNDK